MDNQKPTLLVHPPYETSKGYQVDTLSEHLGMPLDPWGSLLMNVWCGETPEGMWASKVVATCLSRQNGKSTLVMMRMLTGALLFNEKVILYSAHRSDLVRHFFTAFSNFIQENPTLKKRVVKLFSSDGRQYIDLRREDGGTSRILFSVRTAGFSRGLSVDLLIVDEAQDLSFDMLESMLPSQAAVPKAQMILIGTVPGMDANGEVFTRYHDAAKSGTSTNLAWAEWSAPEGSDLDDVKIWERVNPAFGIRISEATIRAEREVSSDFGFAKERLSIWSSTTSPQVIPPEMWTAQELDISDPLAEIVSDRAIAIDTSLDRSKTSVAVAGMNIEGDYVIALLEQFDHPESAVNFVANFVAANDIRAVVVDAQSQAGTLVDLLKRRKVRATVTSERDMAAACGSIYDGAIDGWLYHIGQYQLTQALGQARKRPLLNGAAWAWNRKSEDSDICPLIAVTLALYGSMHSRVKAPGRGETPDFVDLPRRSKPQGMVILN